MAGSASEASPLLIRQPSILDKIKAMPNYLKESTGLPLFEPVMLTADDLSGEEVKFLTPYCGHYYNKSTLLWIITKLNQSKKITNLQKTKAEDLINEKVVDAEVTGDFLCYLALQNQRSIQSDEQPDERLLREFMQACANDPDAVEKVITNGIAFELVRGESVFFGSYKHAPSSRLLLCLSLVSLVGLAAFTYFLFKQYFEQAALANGRYRNGLLDILNKNTTWLTKNVTSTCIAQHIFTERAGICHEGEITLPPESLVVCGEHVGIFDPDDPVFQGFYIDSIGVGTSEKFFSTALFKEAYSMTFAIVNLVIGYFAYHIKNSSNYIRIPIALILLTLVSVPAMVSEEDQLLKLNLCYELNNYLVQIAGNVSTVLSGSKPAYVNTENYSAAFENSIMPLIFVATLLCGLSFNRITEMSTYLFSACRCNHEQSFRVASYGEHMKKGMRIFSGQPGDADAAGAAPASPMVVDGGADPSVATLG